jgi:hypothetical protein
MKLSRPTWHRGRHDPRAGRRLSIWSTAAVLVTVVLVMALLGAEPLAQSADRLAPSALRTVAVAVAGAFAAAGEAVHADWPWQQVAHAGDQPHEEEPDAGAGEAPDATTPPATLVATPPTTLPATPPTSSPVDGTSVTTIASTTTTVEVTTTTTLPVFTAERPLRILVVGDSLMTPVGYALMRQKDTYPALEVKTISKASSGFVRPDFYNWPQVLGQAVAGFHPHVTVMLFGGNEKQVMRYQGQSFDPFSDGWNAEYAKRVGQAVEISTAAGASVVWIGMPIMRSGKFSETARALNAFYSAACAGHPGADYIDGYALFSDAGGKYSAYLVDSAGENQLMRAGDGIHFSEHGGDRIAEAVVEVLLTRYRLE